MFWDKSWATAALGIGLFGMAAAPAMADVSSNYTFPDGSPGFFLEPPGPPIAPQLLVEFNPQLTNPPEPDLNLRDPTTPVLTSPGAGSDFYFVFSFLNIGDPNLVSPGPCRTAGAVSPGPCRTSFSFDSTIGGVAHHFEVDLAFTAAGTDNSVDPASWVAFNPQPDPPADWFGVQFSFAPVPTGDPIMSFQMFEDGNLLSWSVPEPASLALIAGGVPALALLRRRRQKAALAL